MTTELEVGLYIFMLAGFLGYHIITRVPPLLHTPLMSATNAIAAISLVGSLVVAGSDYSHVPHGWICMFLGFLITDRMLGMFKKSADQNRAAQAQKHTLLIIGTILVAAVIALIIWWKE